MALHAGPSRSPGRSRRGFTLIELLVVVAIIALLISILLPSLSKARSQARTALCASRMSQLNKAMLIYAEDFNETPPFILKGCGDADLEDFTDPEDYNDNPDTYDGANRGLETWLAESTTMERIYLLPEEDWYTEGDPRLPESGGLYSYARFANLYRCPEFERVASPDKDQNAFNLTRNILGRKVELANGFELHYKGILKLSAVYNTAQMPMMVDEAWDNYVAWPEDYDWVWGGHDSVYDIMNSSLGQYHGAPLAGYASYPQSEPPGSVMDVLGDVPLKSATVGYYDGHAGLMRDPVPNMEHYGGRPSGDAILSYIISGQPEWAGVYIHWIANFLYAQQGLALEL